MARWKPFPIIGGAYSDDCLPWSHQDTVNYIPVIAEKSGTRSREMLRCLPGYATFCDLGTDAPIRGARNVEGRLFVVSGQTLFSVLPAGVATSLGTIPGVQRCSLSHNQVAGGNQVAISNGQAGYVYNTATSTLVQITDEGFPGSICFDAVDGYITGIDPSRNFAFISDLADATSYNTLDEFQAEGSPDKLRGQAVTHRELWLMGERTIEPFVDTGNGTGTFQRAQGTVIEVGLAATFSVAVMDNSVFWLGSDGIVYRANGYTAVRKSTHAIEQAIARCNMAQAFAFTFEDRGHKVFYLTFPDGQTWGYDAATDEWHRRKSYGLDRWRINTLTLWNGKWIAGDFSNGKLYALDWGVQFEDIYPMERRRITGAFHDSQNNVIINGLELVVDTGTSSPTLASLVPAPSITGTYPGGIVGAAYSAYLTITGGGNAYSTPRVTIGALPDGLSLSIESDKLRLSGTPTADQSFSFTVCISSADGREATSAQTVAITTYADVVSADGPAYWWPLQETVTNGALASNLGSLGYGNLGIPGGVATYFVPSSDLALQPGASIVTGSAKSYAKSGADAAGVQIADTSGVGVGLYIAPTFSVEAWVSLDVTANATPTIIEADEQQRMFQFRCDAGKPTFVCIPTGQAIASPTSITGTGRHYLYASVNGSTGLMELYVDNMLVASATGTTFSAYAQTGGGIGSYRISGQSAYQANGRIAHVAIYNKVLTADRRTAHWEAGK